MPPKQKRKTPASVSEPTECLATRRKTDTTANLVLVSDDLDEDTHIQLDEVIASVGAEPFNPSAAGFLLRQISRNSGHTLNPITFDDAADLLAQYPELMEVLKVAWAKKSFKEIR